MIPINPTAKFWLLVVLAGVVGALKAILTVSPAWSWIGAVVSVLVVVEAYLTVPAATAAKLAKIGPMVAVLCLGFVASGCVQAAASIPADAILLECVIADAVSGDSVPKIVTDCDADAATVINILLSSKSAKVKASTAMKEAQAAHAAR